MEISNGLGLVRLGQQGVAAEVQPPSALGGVQDLELEIGVVMSTVSVSADFVGEAISFALAPSSAPLPAGLSLSTSGLLSGTPTALSGAVSIIVRGTNTLGSADTGFSITVEAMVPILTVELQGLTANPTHGPSAQEGGALTATVSGFSGAAPTTMTYQWKTRESGPISGATSASYLVSANLFDGEKLYCTISSDLYPDTDTESIVIRYAPPTADPDLDLPIILDQGTGPQLEPMAGEFTGDALVFEVTGAGASAVSQTGDIFIPTATVFSEVSMVVTATNSGGQAEKVFLVSVEPVNSADLMVEFGALTTAGAGAVAVTGTSIANGDPSGHWQVSSGVLSPSVQGENALSGVYNLTLNDGQTVDINVVSDKASVASSIELVATFNLLSEANATGILVRDGDYTNAPRMTPVQKSFANLMTIEPHTAFLEGPLPSANSYAVALPGIFLPRDTSNVRFFGLELFETVDGTGTEASGVVELESGSTSSSNIIIESCEIHSRSMIDAYDNAVFGDAPGFSTYASQGAFWTNLNAVRGVVANNCGNLRVLRCHLHDLSRGIAAGSLGRAGGNRSRIHGNHISDVVTNFTTFGGTTDGLDIWDNRGLHTWGSDLEVPSNPLHGAVGLSFDPAPLGERFQNVNVMGNIMAVGWRRRKYTEDSGDTYTAVNSSTGAKFNDPILDGSNAASYENITFAFNTLVTAGIGIEFSGATGVDIFNNTLLKDTVSASGSYPYIYLAGSANTRVWNNVGQAMTLGALDDSGFLVRTLDDLEGYGNQVVASESYFRADEEVGYPYPNVSELGTFYTPDAGRYALLAEQKKGARGTGAYFGLGATNVAFDPPSVSSGSAGNFLRTAWDGSSNFVSSMPTFSSTLSRFTCFFQVSFNVDGTEEYIFGSQFRCLEIYRNSNNHLVVYCKRADFTVTVDCESEFTLNAADGMVSVAVAVDLDLGVVQMVKNGVQDRWNASYDEIALGDTIDGSRGLSGFAKFFSSSPLNGQVDFLWLGNEFFDLDNSADLEALYAANGAFQSFGSLGADMTGRRPEIFLTGTATSFANLGNGGSVTVNGNLTNVVSSENSDLMAGVGDFSAATGWNLGTGLAIAGGGLDIATSQNFIKAARLGGNRVAAQPNQVLDVAMILESVTASERVRLSLRPYDSGGAPILSATFVFDTNSEGLLGAGLNEKAAAYTTPPDTASLEVILEFTISGFIGRMSDLKLTTS